MSRSPDPHARAALLDRLCAALEAELPMAVELRHQLHAEPEPSGAEWRTAETVVDAIGLGPGEAVAETGRLVRVGPTDGPSIAIRSELDGLPGPHGLMHACGHDVHLAALTAVVRAARTVEQEEGLPFPLLAVLQPREERPPSGARDIVQDGVLKRHEVQAIVAAHVQPLLGPGCVAAAPGAVNAAADELEIVVTGHGGHGGYPHLTRDPVVALAQVVVAVQQLISRRTDPLHAAVLTIGTLEAGTAANVVPDVARAEGTLRVLDPDDRDDLQDELRELVESVADGLGCKGEVVIREGEPALINEPLLATSSHTWLADLGYDVDTSLRSCGADDFSYYGDAAPSLMMFVGLPDQGTTLHQPEFHPPDDAVRDVARSLLAGYLGALEVVQAPGA